MQFETEFFVSSSSRRLPVWRWHTSPAAAQDKVSVGVMTVSSSPFSPYFCCFLDQGFFAEQRIETEMTKLMGGPPNIAAMITNQIDAAAVLVTLEGMNANLKKPGVAMFIALDGQNSVYQMDQIVARNGFKADLGKIQGRQVVVRAGPPIRLWLKPPFWRRWD